MHICGHRWVLHTVAVDRTQQQCAVRASVALAFHRFQARRAAWCPQALLALGCMEHRGACSADGMSGDGAGIMTAVPWGLYKAELPDLELHEKTTGCRPATIPPPPPYLFTWSGGNLGIRAS